MNCDPIARWYRWLEYGAFGLELEKCRNRFLDALDMPRRVLMAGEGDGRFSKPFTVGTPDHEWTISMQAPRCCAWRDGERRLPLCGFTKPMFAQSISRSARMT